MNQTNFTYIWYDCCNLTLQNVIIKSFCEERLNVIMWFRQITMFIFHLIFLTVSYLTGAKTEPSSFTKQLFTGKPHWYKICHSVRSQPLLRVDIQAGLIMPIWCHDISFNIWHQWILDNWSDRAKKKNKSVSDLSLSFRVGR